MSKIQNKLILILAILAFVFGLLWSLPAYAVTFTVDSGVTFDPYGNNGGSGPNYYPNGYPYGGTFNQRPVIFLLNPSSINRGSGPIIIAISGNYFVPSAVARLNGVGKVTTYINSNYLQMQLSYADTLGTGAYLVTVYNPTPGGGVSNTATLTINSAQVNNPAPSPAPSPTRTTPTVVKKTTSTSTVAKTANTNNLEANALSSGFLPSNIIQWLLFLILILLAIVLWRKIYVSDKEKEAPLKHG